MKYKLFRSPGNLDKAVRKHELVAVETGKSIDDVAVHSYVPGVSGRARPDEGRGLCRSMLVGRV